MQPYFFPYIGYFSLLDYADEFILFDTAQYDRKGWMKRNRVLKPNDGWQYIQAGVLKPKFKAPIKEVLIDQNDEWKEKIIRQVDHYKNIAPFYKEIVALLKESLDFKYETLVDLNCKTLDLFSRYIGIKCPIKVFSNMNLKIRNIEHAGQWALRISESYGADEYVNPVGGSEIFNPKEFKNLGIKLSFLQHRLPLYMQERKIFEQSLSILDVLMFNGREKTSKIVKDYIVENVS